MKLKKSDGQKNIDKRAVNKILYMDLYEYKDALLIALQLYFLGIIISKNDGKRAIISILVCTS